MNTSWTRRAAMLAGVMSCAMLASGCAESEPDAPAHDHAHDEGGHGHADHDHGHSHDHGASTDDHRASTHADTNEPRWTYPGILGVVTMLPDETNPASGFKIHHEHIPTFINPRSGELAMTSEGVPGMRAMDMEMPPADGVDISGLAVGDKVRFTFAVWDTPRVAWMLTQVEKIDADTPVSFDDKP